MDGLYELAKDLYNEGYHCGIKEDKWFIVWAEAMRRVALGEQYTDDLVNDIYNDQKLTHK